MNIKPKIMGNFHSNIYRNPITFRVLFFAFLLFSLQARAQFTRVKVLENSPAKMRIQLQVGDVQTETVAKGPKTFVRLSVDGLGRSSIAGCPELPQYQSLINIPVCDGMSFKVTKTNEVTTKLSLENQLLFPAQPSRSKSGKETDPLVQDSLVYQQNQFWNGGDASVEKLGVMRNTTLARLMMSPFSYNPVTGEIRKATTMEIEITFKNANLQATNELYAKYYDFTSENAQSTLLNARSIQAKEGHVTGPLHYVVVSSSTFQAALQPLIEWKRKKGFIVTEAYTNNAAVGTTTTSIKAYLKGLYDNATATLPAPTFVLLVGDVAQLPAFEGTTDTHPTDLYYCDWTGDYLPEAYYGRFSGATVADITSQVSKTVEYEKYLMADPSFLNKMLIIAGQDATYGPTHGDGQVNYVNSNYFSKAQYTVYSYPYNISGSSASDIISKISAGVSIANYTAHGMPDGWSDPAFKTSTISSLNNNGKYALMIGNCCLTNKFDESACFGESVMRAQNKGAIGYIGASNDSYWDEDFYFACGFKSVTLTAPYDSKNLGAYDRLFHKNGEPYSAQYITSGQIVNAGNLAVSQSSSSRIQYYWEIYHLMGDPSLMPYLGVPTTNTATFNPMLPLGSTSISITTTPYSYVAVSRGTTLLGATFANASGVANVPLSETTVSGVADVVITAQNKQPFFGTLNIQVPSGPYVWLQTNSISDPNGNSNGVIDFNETAGLSITLKNFGVSIANGVQAKLTTTSPYIVMTDSLESYGDILVGDSMLKSDAFAFQISDSIMDGEKITFNLTITDNASNSWSTTITETVNAPRFEIYSMSVSDAAGNNNNQLDAGETVDITFTGKNTGHAIAPNVSAILTSVTPGIGIINSPFSIGNVGVNEKAIATIQVQVADTIPNPTVVYLAYQIEKGIYSVEKTFTPTIGLVKEDYETGDLTRFLWNSNGGDLPWTVVNTGQYEGNYCSKSGAITDDQKSVIQISLDVIANDSISFFRKVSSEATYDSLVFYIDDVIMGGWSGIRDWERVVFPVTAGTHAFEWAYIKDGSYLGGSDCAWVDFIQFPPVSNANKVPDLEAALNNVLLYPNPTSDLLNIAYRLDQSQSVTIQVYDFNGRLVSTLAEKSFQLQGSNSATLNTSSLGNGLYFVILKTDKTVLTKRFSVVK